VNQRCYGVSDEGGGTIVALTTEWSPHGQAV
jgi:hypothetical protein